MRKILVLVGSIVLIIGTVLGLYASQRNCLVAFATRGYMSFWTGMEILGGLVVSAAVVILLIGFIRDT